MGCFTGAGSTWNSHLLATTCFVLLVGSELRKQPPVFLHAGRVHADDLLDDLRSLRADVEEQNRKLHLEIASLRAFARVDSAARRLGLTQPTADQIQMAREFVVDDRADAAARTAASIEAMTLTRRRP